MMPLLLKAACTSTTCTEPSSLAGLGKADDLIQVQMEEEPHAFAKFSSESGKLIFDFNGSVRRPAFEHSLLQCQKRSQNWAASHVSAHPGDRLPARRYQHGGGQGVHVRKEARLLVRLRILYILQDHG